MSRRPRFQPEADAVYLTDNGRALCGAHLGSSARMTGCDISGQPIMRVTEPMVAEAKAVGWIVACEQCGKRAQPDVAPKVIDLMAALKASLHASAPVEVEFRCEPEPEPDPFPGTVACGWCGGEGKLTTGGGCAECEGTGVITVLA